MRKDGFSLIEVIIAALILALTAGGVLYMFSTEKGTTARSGHQIQAMDFTRQKLEELKNEVRPDWDNAGEPLRQTAPGWTNWETLTGDFGPGGKFEGQGRRYRVTNIDVDGDGTTDYKQVEEVVDWDEPTEK